ncbi:MAG: VWA domain-containing protein, partial [Thermomicrobiales bacterium]
YARPDHDHHPNDRVRLTWLGGDLLYDQAGGAPPVAAARDGAIGLARVSMAGQPGALRPPSATVLPRGVVFGGGSGHADGPPVDEGYNGRLDGSRRTAVTTDHWPADTHDATSSLPELSWDRLSVEEIVRLERALGRLGRKLGGAPGRRRVARYGRLDGHLTARRAATTGGVPFVPVYRERRDDRPRLVVLCDASLSVRGAARFLLALASAAQRQSGRVRGFVYVREVAEATAALASPRFEHAVAEIFGGRLLDTAEASDGGAALATFRDRHASILTPRTTLLILGDGRNNGHDPRVDALAALRRRCRRVIWLTPESRGSWRLAGCDLPRYEAVCDLVTTVRAPADLERLVTGLTQ